MKNRYTEELDNKLQEMKNEGCTGVALFVSDTNDATSPEFASDTCRHIDAIMDARETKEHRPASELGF